MEEREIVLDTTARSLIDDEILAVFIPSTALHGSVSARRIF
jgi:hypothetical protein